VIEALFLEKGGVFDPTGWGVRNGSNKVFEKDSAEFLRLSRRRSTPG